MIAACAGSVRRASNPGSARSAQTAQSARHNALAHAHTLQNNSNLLQRNSNITATEFQQFQ
jgi:hypothetical protein